MDSTNLQTLAHKCKAEVALPQGRKMLLYKAFYNTNHQYSETPRHLQRNVISLRKIIYNPAASDIKLNFLHEKTSVTWLPPHR